VWGLATLFRFRRFPTRLFLRCVVGALVPLPYLVYNFYVFATNPVLAAWSGQNILPSPNPMHYVFGYGVLAILALPAIRWGWQRGKHQTSYLLLPAWVLAGPIFAYIPITVQRRLLEGIFVPLCILAVMGMYLWWRGSRIRRYPRRARLVWRESVIGVLALTLPTSFLILLTSAQAASTPNSTSRLFHSSGEIAALDWLNTHAVPDSVVLCSFDIGNYLPARTSLRAFIGHGPETLNLGVKASMVDRFYAGQYSDSERLTFLHSNTIRYVIFPPGTAPLDVSDLKQVYDQNGYVIDEVQP
jgi:hypothetical protein